jgi:hypothetical protein
MKNLIITDKNTFVANGVKFLIVRTCLETKTYTIKGLVTNEFYYNVPFARVEKYLKH